MSRPILNPGGSHARRSVRRSPPSSASTGPTASTTSALQVPGADGARSPSLEHRPSGHRGLGPQAARALRRRPVAVCLELSPGPDRLGAARARHLRHLPGQPQHAREVPHARSLPAAPRTTPPTPRIALELLLRHREKLNASAPESPTCARSGASSRLDATSSKTACAITNRLTFALKAYFPQVLEWFRDKETDVFADFLERWPIPRRPPSAPDARPSSTSSTRTTCARRRHRSPHRRHPVPSGR